MSDDCEQARDVAFIGGRILTMDDAQPEAEALLVRGGRIDAIGKSIDISSRAPKAEVVDLAGRTVIPGIVDGHCHLELTTVSLAHWLQLHSSKFTTIPLMQAALAERGRVTPAGDWIVGRTDFAMARFVREKRILLRSDLDSAVPDHPCVVFVHMHLCTVNTAAMRQTGLLDGSATLPMGSSIDLETGVAMDVWDWLPLPTPTSQEVATAVHDLGLSMWTARGVTSIAELPLTLTGIHAYQALRNEGRLPVRLGLWLHTPKFGSIDELLCMGLETGFGDDWLSVGGIKVFVNGSGSDMNGDPYFDAKWNQDELDELVYKAHVANLQLWMHCFKSIEGAEMALNAYENALGKAPRVDHRHRLEHVGDFEPRAELLERIKHDELIPVVTPQFTWCLGDDAPEFAATPLATMHRLGFRPPGNSDCTGTQPEAANPWHGIRCALTHGTRSGDTIYAEERIDLASALRMFTRDAARACHWDDRGTLAPGCLADLVVLGADPFRMTPEELPEMPVDMTVIGGRTIWERQR